MKFLLKLLVVCGILGGIGFAARKPIEKWYKERNKITYRTVNADDGKITDAIIATGTVEPVLKVQVGSFVSGPIVELNCDWNDTVEEGQLLAKVDPRLYDAAVARDQAALATRKADLARVQAQLKRAERDLERAKKLRAKNRDFISDTEMDRYSFEKLGLEAQLGVSNAGVDQAVANLETSTANLEYTAITAPVAGIIIDKLIDEGQTLAAGFQTPQLFTIAPGMREKMYVFASIDETDLGLIRKAKDWEDANPDEAGSVKLSVASYPDDVFVARIEQIRMSSTVNQNVVTYPVVLAVANPDLKLLPGMTADLTFKIEEKMDLTRIPNAALRYLPEIERVREEDKKLLEGFTVDEEDDDTDSPEMTVEQRAEASRKRARRHVWVEVEDSKLKAIEVTVGISDNRHTELISGEIDADTKLVVGIEKKK
jgi:HlyD family secretion protein